MVSRVLKRIAAALPAERLRGGSGWWAAAACLVLAFAVWLRPLHAPRPKPAARAAPVSLATARRALLADAGAMEIALDPTEDPSAGTLHGDVVWDPATQRGYLRLAGLPRNDPHIDQYQIWIFDAARDSRYPIDGGVFDCPSPARTLIIPIHAVIPVRRARAFSITLERAGGVVVSAREHVLARAEAG